MSPDTDQTVLQCTSC